MFIQTEAMPDALRMKFYPGETVLPSGSAEFPDEEAAERSPRSSRQCVCAWNRRKGSQLLTTPAFLAHLAHFCIRDLGKQSTVDIAYRTAYLKLLAADQILLEPIVTLENVHFASIERLHCTVKCIQSLT